MAHDTQGRGEQAGVGFALFSFDLLPGQDPSHRHDTIVWNSGTSGDCEHRVADPLISFELLSFSHPLLFSLS